jgi:protein-disulfide isomerase
LSSIHPWAQKAAEAAECAHEQDKYWEYHDILFQNQDAINTQYSSGALDAVVGTFKDYATQLGLDATAFGQCLDGDKYADEIQKDYQDGVSYGVQGTPAFFINGLLISGAQPYANFKVVIDAALQ